MATIRILNTDGIQQVFVAADEATVLAQESAIKAEAAALLANEAAQGVATVDKLVEQIYALIRARLGSSLGYTRRGEWLETGLYVKDDLVSYPLEGGTLGLFVAVANVPVGVPPTDTAYWLSLGASPVAASIKLSSSLGEDGLVLEPGESAQVQLELEAFNLPGGTAFVFGVLSDEPGLRGAVVPVADDQGQLDEDDPLADANLGDDEEGERSDGRLELVEKNRPILERITSGCSRLTLKPKRLGL